jgi:O-antigen/teichoic acid export membrane protein
MIAAGVLSIAISISIARWLGAADFGMYSVVVSVQGVVGLLASFSVGTAIAKYVSEYRSRDEEEALRFAKSGFVLVVILAALVGIVYASLGALLGKGLYKESAMVGIIPFSAVMVFSSSVFSTSMGVVQGCQRFRLLSGMQVSSPLLSLAMISALLPPMGVKGVFVGYSVSQLVVSSLVLAILNRSGFRFVSARLELGRNSLAMAKMYSFALPAVLGGLMVVPIVWIANTELTLSTGFQAMGYFAVAYVIYQALIMIPSAISIPMMPRVSQLTVGSHEDVQVLVAKVMRTLSIALFPLLFAAALFSGFIVETLYGSRFSASTEVVYLMVTTAYFYSLGAVVGTMITGTGRMWLGLGLNAFWAAMFLIFVFAGVPIFGTKGLAVSYAAAYGIFLVFLLVASERLLHVKITGMYLAGASSAILFSVGFFLQGETNSFGFFARLALFAGGVAYFYLIGRDVFEALYLRVRGILCSPGSSGAG